MERGVYELGNGLKINAKNPETHVKPQYCGRCDVLYYFGGHYCTEKNKPNKAFKRAIQGYYNGE